MENQNNKPIIEVKDLNVIYNKGKTNEMRALENINVEIFPQEYVIIFGPSGCGKSTLLYSIAGLQRPTSGQVVVDSVDISSLSKKKLAEYHRNTMGMVFQAFYLVPSINVLDNVCLPKVFAEEDPQKREKRAIGLLERFNIEAQRKRFPSELSGGQKQRVSIARSLVNDPKIILADEPVGNLDSKSSHNVMMILKELNEQDKKTIILVTHDPSHLPYGDKIIHMKDGKMVKVEIVKNKKKIEDEKIQKGSYIFKEGKLKEDLVKSGLIKEEFVSPDIKLLMRSFGNLSLEQLGNLLVPFKVQQLFSHVFFSMTDEQLEVAKKRLQDLLYDKINYEEFKEELDKDMSRGGAGWDKRNMEKFSYNVFRILDQSASVDFSQPNATAIQLRDYVVSQYNLRLNDVSNRKLAEVMLDRIQNRVGYQEVKKICDMSQLRGGLGLDSRTALKIAREIEIILLVRYSG